MIRSRSCRAQRRIKVRSRKADLARGDASRAGLAGARRGYTAVGAAGHARASAREVSPGLIPNFETPLGD